MQPKVIGVITLAEERQLHMKNEHDGSLTTGVRSFIQFLLRMSSFPRVNCFDWVIRNTLQLTQLVHYGCIYNHHARCKIIVAPVVASCKQGEHKLINFRLTCHMLGHLI